jgi:hypothetical protein
MEMGSVLGAEAGAAGAAGTAKDLVVEQGSDIEEIARSAWEEDVRPQRIRVARQRHSEWVFHEEDWTGASSRQIRHTLEKLYNQVQVSSKCNTFVF